MAKRDSDFYYIHLPAGAGWFKLKKDGTRFGVHAYNSGIRMFEMMDRSNGSHIMGAFEPQPDELHGLANIDKSDMVCVPADRYHELLQIEERARRELDELRAMVNEKENAE